MEPRVKYRPLSVGDCAALLNMSPEAVKKLIQRGALDPTWTTAGRHLIAYGELVQWASLTGRRLQPLDILDGDPRRPPRPGTQRP